MKTPAVTAALPKAPEQTASSVCPSRRFHGIVPPLITPLVTADVLDIAGLERLVDHVLVGGVHGLFVLGTTSPR